MQPFFPVPRGTKKFIYAGDDDPANWTGTCRSGVNQSPIDLNPEFAVSEPFDSLVFGNYDFAGDITLENTGITVKAKNFETWSKNRPYIKGGGLNGTYDLLEFHFHWSQSDYTGSEHTLASFYSPAELHLVHIERGRSLGDGKPLNPDTLAVIGIFIEIGCDGSTLSDLIPSLYSIRDAGNKTKINNFMPQTLLPKHTDVFYRYMGSLTTPGCDEIVVWTVLADPICVTQRQLDEFRNIRFRSGQTGKNYRPTMPLNGRRVSMRSPDNNMIDRIDSQSLLDIVD